VYLLLFSFYRLPISSKITKKYKHLSLQLTVGYLNVTINRKPEMQNPTLALTSLAKPGETHVLTSMGPGLACQEAADRVVALFWNRTELFLQSTPKPLVGYPDPLLTLLLAELQPR